MKPLYPEQPLTYTQLEKIRQQELTADEAQAALIIGSACIVIATIIAALFFS